MEAARSSETSELIVQNKVVTQKIITAARPAMKAYSILSFLKRQGISRLSDYSPEKLSSMELVVR